MNKYFLILAIIYVLRIGANLKETCDGNKDGNWKGLNNLIFLCLLLAGVYS